MSREPYTGSYAKVYQVTEDLDPLEKIDCEYGEQVELSRWAQLECERWWEKNWRRAWVDVVPNKPGFMAIFTNSLDHIEQGPEE